MKKNELLKEIERVERAIWYEQMADFMDWNAYYSLKRELSDLRKQLEEAE